MITKDQKLDFTWGDYHLHQYTADIDDNHQLSVWIDMIDDKYQPIMCIYKKGSPINPKDEPPYRPIALSNKASDYPIFDEFFPRYLWPVQIYAGKDYPPEKRTPHESVQDLINEEIYDYILNAIKDVVNELDGQYADHLYKQGLKDEIIALVNKIP